MDGIAAIWLVERLYKNGDWVQVGPVFTELEQVTRWLKGRLGRIKFGTFRVTKFKRTETFPADEMQG